MTRLYSENPFYALLRQRVPEEHLQKRLEMERAWEKKISSRRIDFFHSESWYSIHAFIRHTLRLGMLHERGKRNALELQVTMNDLFIKDLPPEFENYRIAHISDLHIDMNDDIPRVLAETLRQTDFDLCVVTGDLRARTHGSYENAINALQSVKREIDTPIYAVLGNHDTIEMVPALEGMGIPVLLNEVVELQRGDAKLSLAGIDDPHYFQLEDLKKVTRERDVLLPSILLSHSPEPYEAAANAGFDAFLCGHTHGGQICLPGGFAMMKNARCPRSLCNGAWQYGEMHGYTSRGSGVSVVDVRFNCQPEVSVHRLRAR